MELKQKHIVITGGTSGIGRHMVEQLCQHNQLTVIGRNKTKLKALEQASNNITTYQVDLANLQDAHKVATAIRDTPTPVDILINNAAVQYTPTFLEDDFDHASIANEITVNFTSVCCLIHTLLPKLLGSNNAVILNVNSGLGLTPKRSSAVYCGTKGALNIFTQSLRYQLDHTTIKVQQAFLPLVETAMTEGRGEGEISADEAATHLLKGIENGILDNYIGKVAVLRFLLRFLPSAAHTIMKTA